MQNRGFVVSSASPCTQIINFMKPLFRWQKKTLIEALKTRRVLVLSGARQCGKTTLAKQLGGGNATFRTLDDVGLRQIAQSDPHGFVERAGKMLIIDEIQRAPELLSAIKLVVDQDTSPGQYLLTGSANIQSLPAVAESLAGRIRKVQLRPFSQGELVGANPIFLEKAFEQNFAQDSKKHHDRRTILEMAFRGGFPESVELGPKDAPQWHKDYMTALLERDLVDIAHITRQDQMRKLVEIVAAWSSKYIDISSIGSSLSIRRPTIEAYINALEALFIIEKIPPFTRTDYERVGKQSKLFMLDSGLMASLLRWRMDQVEFDADRSGKLIETFVHNEVAAQIDASNNQYELFHYRDREQREIDFLIEREDGALLGIEVKAGSAVHPADFKHLKWFRDHIAQGRSFTGIVLYSGEMAGSMGDHLWVVPFGALWAN